RIPLTQNNKIDRKRLPEPQFQIDTGVEYIKPRTDIQKAVAEICEDILEVSKIGIKNSLFDLGANSIKVIMIITKIFKKFNVKLEIIEVFEGRTVEKISNSISARLEDNNNLDMIFEEMQDLFNS